MKQRLLLSLLSLSLIIPIAEAKPAGPATKCQLVAIPSSVAVVTPTTPPALSQLAAWQSNQNTWGQPACNFLFDTTQTTSALIDGTYYDAESVYYQLYDLTGNSGWLTCAQQAEAIYRDQDVFPNNGNVPGYWIFTRGLTTDALRTGDPQSFAAVHLLATNGAFASDTDYNNTYLAGVDGSRENAYVLEAYLDDEKLGQPLNPRYQRLANYALGHIETWVGCKAQSVKPFMVALTSQALIQYYNRTGDSRVIPHLAAAADWLWANTWLSSYQSFKYCNVTGPSNCNQDPAPDLNLLIAPVYSWLWHQTGQQRFLDRGDQVFNGGVLGAYLGDGKHFDQNYRWSDEYVAGRQ